ncbi:MULTISPECIES: BglG family transcription antiterminator [unclassified Luteococcus]|uniref:BglG family transcription antiterminator n=1 Tax=unclassified Luteococcus TaxID=2639923 RepID=UPI00313CF886
MPQDRRRALLAALSRASRPLSGEELGSMLSVSSRTVRTYVSQLNQDDELVATSHQGYSLTATGRAQALSAPSPRQQTFDTPQRRLGYLCRTLPQSTEPVDFYQLAAQLCVSDSTLEADLSRAREVLREHDVVLRRDHEKIWVDGAERSRRRVVRQVLQQNGHDMAPDWDAIAQEFTRVDLPHLRQAVSECVAESEIEMNEYALGDVVLHLVVTVDRIQSGHVIPENGAPVVIRDSAVEELCRRLGERVAGDNGTELPEAELNSLYAAIAVRTVGRSQVNSADLVSPDMLQLVSSSMEWVAQRYLLGPPDRAMLLKLAVHVDNVVARARSGVALAHPLGSAFRHSHPLVHELALAFAERLEEALGVEISPSEVDYLSLHMGMLYMTFLEQRDLPTITLVAPRYHGLEETLTTRLADSLRGKAVLERTLNSWDGGRDQVTSDLMVSCIPLPAVDAPVVQISPLLPHADVDRILRAARTERERLGRERMVTLLRTLIDPSLFLHVEAVPTKREALTLMCARLEEQGYVDEGFLEDCMDRERRSPTSFGGAFAIPHSMRMDAKATGVAVLVSDRGIPWGPSSVRVVLLFSLSEAGRRSFRDGLDEIIRLLGEPGTVEALGATTTAEDFLAVLNRASQAR